MSDRLALPSACLRAELDRVKRRLSIRLGPLLVVQHVLLFAALHLWPPHG
jgi:hypothetical protein